MTRDQDSRQPELVPAYSQRLQVEMLWSLLLSGGRQLVPSGPYVDIAHPNDFRPVAENLEHLVAGMADVLAGLLRGGLFAASAAGVELEETIVLEFSGVPSGRPQLLPFSAVPARRDLRHLHELLLEVDFDDL